MDKRILLYQEDPRMREVLTDYLGWYGFAVEKVGDFYQVVPQLMQEKYDLLICDEWVECFDSVHLCAALRKTGNAALRSTRVMLVGLEEPDQERNKLFKKMDINFIVKYQGVERWFEKINAILGVEKACVPKNRLS